jgi:hypothetical protein
MDFKAVVLVLLVYFIRPQDWVAGLIGVGIVAPIMVVAIITMITRARREKRNLHFLGAPHDWAMLAYYVYVVYTSPDPSGTFKEAFSLFAFYFVTVQALDTPTKLLSYMKAWMWAVSVLAALGVMSIYGWDLTGARPMTEANLGRLALGTWMHSNPNALGHTVMTAVPLSYYLYFWKGTIQGRLMAISIWLIAYEAIFETQSKGAVLAGFVTLVVSYSFGKSKFTQAVILGIALAAGGAVISFMPRMEKMGDLRSDEGVQGRLLAWEQARLVVKNDYTGEGWKHFRAIIKWEKLMIPKATHSSYVKIGADLGYPGMFVYVGILWLGFRSLFRRASEDLAMERSRRALFTLISAYVISNWMIDRAYHTEYFLFMAAIGAWHRMEFLRPRDEAKDEFQKTPVPGWFQMPVCSWLAVADQQAEVPESARGAINASLLRPSFMDLAMAGLGAWLIFYLWDYILTNL